MESLCGFRIKVLVGRKHFQEWEYRFSFVSGVLLTVYVCVVHHAGRPVVVTVSKWILHYPALLCLRFSNPVS